MIKHRENDCYNQTGDAIPCPLPGAPHAQDGSYTLNPPTYSDNGDGTVTDNYTGLIWQQTADETSRDWYSALSYCSDNTDNLPGSEWRLPTIEELAGIRDLGKEDPAANAVFYIAYQSTKSYYWTSTTFAGIYHFPDSEESAWYVDFLRGIVKHKPKSGKGAFAYTRCVRNGL